MKNTGEGRLEVTAIENGTVIDHIPASNLFKIIRILGLENENHRITFGTNLESKRMGTKAIIKINDRFCKQEEINRIAIVAPMAVVNIIRDFKVVEKHAVTIPQTIRGFVKCANPKCVTNNEPVETSFLVIRNGADKCREQITHPNAHFIDNIHPLAKMMFPLAEKAIAEKDFKDVAYFEPFYLKEFVASQPKKLL